MAMDLIDRHAI